MSDNIDFIIKGFKNIELINGGYYGVCAKLVLDIIDKTEKNVIESDFVTFNQYSLQPVTDESILEFFFEDEESDDEHQLTDEMISEYFQMLLDEAYEDPKDILAGGGYIPYDGNYHEELDVRDEIEELLASAETVEESDDDEMDERPEVMFEINGSSYTEKELIDILREQLSGLRKYSQFNGASIEFCHQNNHGDLFFYVTRDDGEDMMVKIGHDENIYWDWTGPVMED